MFSVEPEIYDINHFMVRLPVTETRGHEISVHVEYLVDQAGFVDANVWLQCDSVTEFERFLAAVCREKLDGSVEQCILDYLDGDSVFRENVDKLLDLVGQSYGVEDVEGIGNPS